MRLDRPLNSASSLPMSSHDFLHVHARTELSEDYVVGGFVFRLTTNHSALLDSVRSTWPRTKSVARPAFSWKFWVDDDDASGPPWPQPCVRGLMDRVYAGFAAKSSVLADLRGRLIIGRFSPAMAADIVHWKTIVLPVLMSIMAGSIGMVELHASCVARDGRGIILLGPSRSGKSTLAMALLHSGLQLLSDDRIFCSLHNRNIIAYGLPRPLKLRSEASRWFKDVGKVDSVLAPNGEQVFYCQAGPGESSTQSRTCQPIALIFLNQQDTGFRMIRTQPSETRLGIEADLLAETPDAAANQQPVLDYLTSLPCWQLLYNGSPQWIARQILEHVFERVDRSNFERRQEREHSDNQ